MCQKSCALRWSTRSSPSTLPLLTRGSQSGCCRRRARVALSAHVEPVEIGIGRGAAKAGQADLDTGTEIEPGIGSHRSPVRRSVEVVREEVVATGLRHTQVNDAGGLAGDVLRVDAADFLVSDDYLSARVSPHQLRVVVIVAVYDQSCLLIVGDGGKGQLGSRRPIPGRDAAEKQVLRIVLTPEQIARLGHDAQRPGVLTKAPVGGVLSHPA